MSASRIGTVVAISFLGAPPPTPERGGESRSAPRESVWKEEGRASESLVLLGFPDAAAAGDDLRRLVEGADPSAPDPNPPTEVHHVAISRKRGEVLDEPPTGGFVVVTRSLANPGYCDELRESLGEMLATFAQLPG